MKIASRLSWFMWPTGLILPVATVLGLGWYRPSGQDRPGDSKYATQQNDSVACFGYADVEYGIISLHPTQPGRVATILVRENEEVAAGTSLLRLDDRMARFQLDEANAAYETAQIQLAQARRMPDQHRVKMAQQQAAIRAARQRLLEAKHAVAAKENQQRLHDIGRYRPDPVVAEQVAAARANVEQVEAMEQAELEKAKELELQDPEADVRRATADVATREAHLAQARPDARGVYLDRPLDGTILRILVGPGHLVTSHARQSAIEFCPRAERIIRVEVDQEFAARVALGQSALIKDDVNDGTTWRGRLARISDWYTQRRVITDDPLHLKDVRTLECLITLEPGQPAIRIGQRVRVKINDPRSADDSGGHKLH